jgi:hypothetical protein
MLGLANMSGTWNLGTRVNQPLGPKPYKEQHNIIEHGEHALWAPKFPMACAHSNNAFIKAPTPTPTQINASIMAMSGENRHLV